MSEQYYITNKLFGKNTFIVTKGKIIRALLNEGGSWYNDYLGLFGDLIRSLGWLNDIWYKGVLKQRNYLDELFDRDEPLPKEKWAEIIFQAGCDPVEPYENNKFVDKSGDVFDADGNYIKHVE